jgi:hypothetical protein
VLKNCVLLKPLWVTAVVKPNHVVYRQAPVEDLTADEHVQLISKVKLTSLIQKALQLSFAVYDLDSYGIEVCSRLANSLFKGRGNLIRCCKRCKETIVACLH